MRRRRSPKGVLARHTRACLRAGMAELKGSRATARVPTLFTPDPERSVPHPPPCRDMQMLCFGVPRCANAVLVPAPRNEREKTNIAEGKRQDKGTTTLLAHELTHVLLCCACSEHNTHTAHDRHTARGG